MTYTSYPISLGRPPSPQEGPRYIPIAFDITASLHDVSFTRTINVGDSGMASIQSIEIDNSMNAGPISVKILDTNQRVSVPANSIVVSPIYAQKLSVQIEIRWQWKQTPFPYASPLNCRLFNFEQSYSCRPAWNMDPSANRWNSPDAFSVSVASGEWEIVLDAGYRSKFVICYDQSALANEQWYVGFSSIAGNELPLVGIGLTGPISYSEIQTGLVLPITQTSIWVKQSSGSTRTISVFAWNV